MPAAPPPLRRTQDERRSTTRAALLDATIECLVELGYARTSTTEVARRAGVSQGALFKHFPTKSALMAAATEELFATLIERFGAAFAGDVDAVPQAAQDELIVVALRRLWEVFCHPSLRAVYLLYAEAPADDELCATLAPVVKRHADHLVAFAVALFPAIATSVELRAFFDGVLFAMQGASLQRPIHVDPARERAMLAQFEISARALFVSSPKKLAKPASRKRVP